MVLGRSYGEVTAAMTAAVRQQQLRHIQQLDAVVSSVLVNKAAPYSSIGDVLQCKTVGATCPSCPTGVDGVRVVCSCG